MSGRIGSFLSEFEFYEFYEFYERLVLAWRQNWLKQSIFAGFEGNWIDSTGSFIAIAFLASCLL